MKRLVSGIAASVLACALVGVPSPAHAAVNTTPFGPRPWLVEDLAAGPGHANIQGNRVSKAGDRFVFSALSTGIGHELFSSDGTAAGTRALVDIPGGGGEPDYLVSMGAKVFFPLTDASGDRELWGSNGTPGGTSRLKDLNPIGDSQPRLLTRLGSRFVFEATNASGLHQLWVSDGTVSGTKVAGTGAPAFSTFFNTIQVSGSKVFFSVSDAEHGNEAWVWDGTSSAPAVIDLVPGPTGSGFLSFPGATFQGAMYGAADTGSGFELYRSNGTPGGTTLVREINPTGTASPSQFLAAHGLLYFSASNGLDGSEIWASDGTASGTVMLRDIVAGAGGSAPQSLTALGSRVLFSANGPQGRELWTTSGTPWSTRLVKDVAPGAGSGVSGRLLVTGGRVWFAGTDTGAVVEHGKELWSSDGTTAGTRLHADLRPDDTGTGLHELHVAVAGSIFMTGASTDHGFELWSHTWRTSRTKASPKSAYARSLGLTKKVVVPVTVTASGTTPLGKVTIKRNGVVWGTAGLVGGVAKVRLTRALGKGSHTGFRAYYTGSTRARSSTSTAFTVRIL